MTADRMLANVVDEMKDANVFVTSDHGFVLRPKQSTPTLYYSRQPCTKSGKPGHKQRN